jgi:hypothetical protein
MPYQRDAEAVLAIWRGVERELESTESGSPEAEFLQAKVAGLRDEYQQLDEQAPQNAMREPPAGR